MLCPSLAKGIEVEKANRVKVAYLYNFTRYVEWPAEAFEGADSPFVIAVLGDDPFGKNLDRIAKKRHHAVRPIEVRRYQAWEQGLACHVLFVASSVAPEERQRAINDSRTAPLLIVSDVGAGGSQASPLKLYLDSDGTIGFEINVSETRRRGLRVNAKLLKLARVVNTPDTATTQSLLRNRYQAIGSITPSRAVAQPYTARRPTREVVR